MLCTTIRQRAPRCLSDLVQHSGPTKLGGAPRTAALHALRSKSHLTTKLSWSWDAGNQATPDQSWKPFQKWSLQVLLSVWFFNREPKQNVSDSCKAHFWFAMMPLNVGLLCHVKKRQKMTSVLFVLCCIFGLLGPTVKANPQLGVPFPDGKPHIFESEHKNQFKGSVAIPTNYLVNTWPLFSHSVVDLLEELILILLTLLCAVLFAQKWKVCVCASPETFLTA